MLVRNDDGNAAVNLPSIVTLSDLLFDRCLFLRLGSRFLAAGDKFTSA